jgi:hypothetical protein
MLVVPISFCSAVKLFYHGWKDNRFQEIFPLLLVEINTVLMWFCLGYAWLYLPVLKLNSTNYSDQIIFTALRGSINIEPLNIFMYTWRFIETLESEQIGWWRQASKWFRIVSIWLVPIAYIGLGVCLLLLNAKAAVALNEGNK